MRNERGDEHSEDEKREVHDAAVDVVPRAIRLDGPRDRDPLPEHEPGEAARTSGADTAEPRALDATVERRGRQNRGDNDRGSAEPRESIGVIPAAEEERPDEK